jgi:D-aminopeptidase
MNNQKRLRDFGVNIGELPTGLKNAITDVPGVRVAHVTLNEGSVKTGVTAILPHTGNIFQEKLLAAVHVINGFGKSIGTVQIEELGTLETPILLTNTLSVGTVADALVRYMMEQNPEIGSTTGTVNPIVCECNDMYLNDIRGLHVKTEHVFEALANVSEEFSEGGVGAGTGMSCYGLKGGIGSASRVVTFDEKDYTVGVLVMSNFGRPGDLLIDGVAVQRQTAALTSAQTTAQHTSCDDQRDKGSIIMIVATDLPLTERQLKRIARRTEVGLVRTGSYVGHGSGDIALAFSTAHRIPHEGAGVLIPLSMLAEDRLDLVFRAVAEATEEAILNSLVTAETTVGRDGNRRESLRTFWP